MPSENKSPSYLREREQVRKWLLNTPDGKMATELLKKNAPNQNAAPILDDDTFTSWADIVEEYKGGVLLASNCEEARSVWEMSRGPGKNTFSGVSDAGWNNFFSAPMGYVFRRQIEENDPEYWNDPINVYREAIDNPQWCRVSREYLVGKLEQLLPKGKKIEVAK